MVRHVSDDRFDQFRSFFEARHGEPKHHVAAIQRGVPERTRMSNRQCGGCNQVEPFACACAYVQRVQRGAGVSRLPAQVPQRPTDKSNQDWALPKGLDQI